MEDSPRVIDKLSSLSFELLHHICNFIHNPRHLSSVCQTSKTLRQFVLKRLYTARELSACDLSVKDIKYMFNADNEGVKYIRSVSFEEYGNEDYPRSPRLRSIRALIAIIPYQLESLTFNIHIRDIKGILNSIYQSQRGLRELRFHEGNLFFGQGEQQSIIRLHDLAVLRLPGNYGYWQVDLARLRSLRELDIQSSQVLWRRSLNHESLLNLTRLTIHHLEHGLALRFTNVDFHNLRSLKLGAKGIETSIALQGLIAPNLQVLHLTGFFGLPDALSTFLTSLPKLERLYLMFDYLGIDMEELVLFPVLDALLVTQHQVLRHLCIQYPLTPTDERNYALLDRYFSRLTMLCSQTVKLEQLAIFLPEKLYLDAQQGDWGALTPLLTKLAQLPHLDILHILNDSYTHPPMIPSTLPLQIIRSLTPTTCSSSSPLKRHPILVLGTSFGCRWRPIFLPLVLPATAYFATKEDDEAKLGVMSVPARYLKVKLGHFAVVEECLEHEW